MAQQGSRGTFQGGEFLLNSSVRLRSGAGVPSNGTSGTGAGKCGPGSLRVQTNGVTWQNVGTKASPVWVMVSGVARATLSAANIIAMNGAPVSVLAAPGAGLGVVIDWIVLVMITTSTQFTGGGAVQFNYHGGSSSHSGTIPASVVTATAGTTLTQLGPATGASGLTVPVNTGIDITNATGAFAAGTGTAVVYMGYSVVPNA